MERQAACQCGAFHVVAVGEPDSVALCHCLDCQRRSGVAFTCNAFFRKGDVRLEGDYRVYARDGGDGRKVNNHFCPTCGSTVCWTLDLRPNHYGIAVGAFNDPSFPAPRYSVWEATKHSWVAVPDGAVRFEQGRPA
jgi:hypothetical protein